MTSLATDRAWTRREAGFADMDPDLRVRLARSSLHARDADLEPVGDCCNHRRAIPASTFPRCLFGEDPAIRCMRKRATGAHAQHVRFRQLWSWRRSPVGPDRRAHKPRVVAARKDRAIRRFVTEADESWVRNVAKGRLTVTEAKGVRLWCY